MLVGIISEDAECRGFLAANTAILAAFGGKSTLLRLDSEVPARWLAAPSGLPNTLMWSAGGGPATLEIATAGHSDALRGASFVVCCGNQRQLDHMFHVEHVPVKTALLCSNHEEFERAIRERNRSQKPALLPYPLLSSASPFPVLTEPMSSATRALMELHMEIFTHE